MRLIGISGLKTSGKDTTYRIINDLLPGVTRVAFADKLKIAAAEGIGFDARCGNQLMAMDECKEIWDFRVGHIDSRESWFMEFTGRQYLQWFGQGMRTVFGENFWVDQVLPSAYNPPNIMLEGKSMRDQKMADMYPGTETLVVTDVRYPNEAERIKDLGGEVWEVIRPGLTSDGHSSEIPLPRELVDREVDNSGDISALFDRVEEALAATGSAIISL